MKKDKNKILTTDLDLKTIIDTSMIEQQDLDSERREALIKIIEIRQKMDSIRIKLEILEETKNKMKTNFEILENAATKLDHRIDEIKTSINRPSLSIKTKLKALKNFFSPKNKRPDDAEKGL